MINITINGKPYEYEEQLTIYHAAKEAGVWIPTLCYNEKLKPYGGCRICLIEVTGRPMLVPSCATYITEGMEIITDSDRVKSRRRFIIELLRARTPESVEIQELEKTLNVDPTGGSALDSVGTYLLKRAKPPFETNCILCGLCVRVCAEITERHALSYVERGMRRRVKTPFAKVADTCIGCGSCAYVCPTNCITIEEA